VGEIVSTADDDRPKAKVSTSDEKWREVSILAAFTRRSALIEADERLLPNHQRHGTAIA